MPSDPLPLTQEELPSIRSALARGSEWYQEFSVEARLLAALDTVPQRREGCHCAFAFLGDAHDWRCPHFVASHV